MEAATIEYGRFTLLPERFAKDLFVGVYSPGRRLVEFQVEKKNVVGALAAISSLLARFGVNINSGFVTAYPDRPKSLFSCIADLTGLEVTPEQVAEELRRLDVVLDVRFHGARIEGLLVDEFHFPILATEERTIMLRVGTIADMLERIYRRFGSGRAFILYEMGVSAGKNKIGNIRGKYGLDGIAALEIVLAERVAKGWGIPEVTEFNRERSSATVIVHELFECLPFRKVEKEPRSHFFRGYLVGVLT